MNRKFWYGVLAIALVLSLGWGWNEYRQAGELRQATENQNQRAFRDLASQLDQLETDLAKGQVASTTNQKVLYLSQAGSHSEATMKDLAQIPAEESGLSYVGQFVNQVGDFTRNAAQKVAIGTNLTTEEEKTLADVHDRVQTMNRQVQDLLVRVDTENLAWTNKPTTLRQRLSWGKAQVAEASAEGQDVQPSSVRAGLDQLNASLQKLPPFSYTGEFATRSVAEPLGLPKQDITKDQALNVANDFLAKVGSPGVNLEFAGVSSGPLGGYLWKQGDISLTVSKRGGVVTEFWDQRTLQERTLTADQAKSKAMTTLKGLGWTLVPTSVEDYGGYIRLEVIDEVAKVRHYPDKIRLTVALDNGQITAYDATPYYAYHHTRNLKSKISAEQAKTKLRSGFQIKETGLAVIPVLGNREVLAYEFRGTYQGEEYLVYVNAESGLEEKIQRIIKTPRGEYLQ
ncbi:PepSY1/2 domain-containing protein [Desulfitobacterium metallireducens]|uniref:Germination protein YpeB n=1 Tax=Desulfitobacterium metallireducens DSM 15288 TaxID=871968 RepID=W0EGW9_9FIRM|nr:PepSY1/2 domain-containing protein [Desulfitobacterium metallireducens]AHF08301.1 germination protein YpeB [Desulfitobacterium metallireducens DSM 15288]